MKLSTWPAVCVLTLASQGASVLLRAQEADPALLSDDARFERPLAGGGRATFAIDLRADDFIQVVVEQKGIDVVAQLAAPDGTVLFTQDSPNGSFGLECVAYVATTGGRYRLIVSSYDKFSEVPPGTFELHVVARRTSTSDDVNHALLERAFAEGNRLRIQNTAASRAEAIELFQVALRHSEALALRHEEALASYGIGLSHLRGAEPREAIPYLERSIPIFQQLGAVMYASGLNALGGAHDLLGDARKAREYYQQALSYFRNTGSIAGEGIAHNNLGKLYADTADWQFALTEYRVALSLFRTMRDINREALALYNIGVSYVGLGDFDRGSDFLQQALDIRIKTDDKAGQADALTNLGRAEMGRGEPMRALRYLQRAVGLRELVGDRRMEGLTTSLIGEAHLSLGNVTDALDALGNAYRLQTSAGDSRGAALTMVSRAGAYALAGRQEDALVATGEAVRVLTETGDTNSTARALTAMAEAERAMGRFDAALEHAERAVALVENVRARVSNADLRATYFARRHTAPKTYIDLLMELGERHPNTGYVSRALIASERARGRSLVDILNESRLDITRGVDASAVSRERQLEDLLKVKSERLMPLVARDRQSKGAQALMREIGMLEAEYEDLRAAIRKASPAYSALTEPQPIDIATIQRELLDEETLLIEYSLGDKASYAWVAGRHLLRGVRLASKTQIEEVARNVSELVTARGALRPGETTAQKQRRVAVADAALPAAVGRLSELVVAPIGSLAPASRLLVVADGALQYIPFGMLTVMAESGPSRPLIADFEVVTMPSVSVLAVQRAQTSARSKAAGGVAVIADPVFDRADVRLGSRKPVKASQTEPESDDTLRILEHIAVKPTPGADASVARSVIPRLPFTRNEADAILSAAKGQKNFRAVDFAATKEAVLGGALKDYRIIHFATHGFLDTERPSLSSIVLSLVDRNGKARDGFLRSQELYNLELNADLVVLSACQTGLGKSIEGEGLIGLTRGLMYAGAARVVVSLWNVSDKATAALMGRFYRDMLAEGKSPSAALRAAQLAVMKEKGWENPYYWAPFVMQGDWR